MARVISWWRAFRETLPGQVVLAAVYAAMLVLVLICFTGNGTFLYELG